MNQSQKQNHFAEGGNNSSAGGFHSYHSSSYRSFAPESVHQDLPLMPQISSFQKSKQFVESHSTTSSVEKGNFISELRNQHRLEKQPSQSIPIIHLSSTGVNEMSNQITSSTVEQHRATPVMEDMPRMVVAPVHSVQRSLTRADDSENDSAREAKTVTIKRKITRRKKGAESQQINTLRDSYIDKISSNLHSYNTGSDSDDGQVNVVATRPQIQVSEIIPLKQAKANEAPPSILISSPNAIQEDTIIPQKKAAVANSAFMSFLNDPVDTMSIKSNEYRQGSDWDYRDTTTPSSQPWKHLVDETFINEVQAAPVSTYSARKENIKSQQMSDDKSIAARTFRPEQRNTVSRNETTEEIETITLQPIGKGVQDLAINQSLSRPTSRAATPRGFEGGTGTIRSNYYRDENQHMGGYGTVPMMPKFAKTNSVRNVHQSANYDATDSFRHGGSVQHLANDQSRVSSFTRAYRSTNEQPQQASANRMMQETIPASSMYRSSNAQRYNTSFDRPGMEQTLRVSPSRAANEQTINASWQSRTETFGTGTRAYQSPVSPSSNQGSGLSNVVTMSHGDSLRCTLQMVINSEEQWYQPHFSRDDVIRALRDKEPGSFYIRTSATFDKAFGLAMKVDSLPDNAVRTSDTQGDLVRHFLIETLETGGVRLKGFATESVYPSLAHLVHAHCQNAIALPIRLLLPPTQFSSNRDQVDGSTFQSNYEFAAQQTQNQQATLAKAPLLSESHRSLSSPGVNFTSFNHSNPLHQYYKANVMYLGKVEIDRLNGDEAIEHAVNKVMKKPSPKSTTVEIQLDSTKGITMTDKLQKMFYTRQIPAQHVLYAAFDPKNREFASKILQYHGINRGKIIGIVVKKQNMILKENAVHLFCELDSSNSIGNIITYINSIYRRM